MLYEKKRVFILILFAIIVLLLYLFIFKTNFFSIQTIKVLGNVQMSYDQIVNASLFNKGENIFKINIEDGENSILRLPYVKNCNIKRKLPNNIIIEIEERQEVANFSHGDHFAYIDEEGYILTIEEKKEGFLPQLTLEGNRHLKIGDNLFQLVNIENLDEFMIYSNELNLINIMKYINLTDNDNIMIQLNNNIKVAFGPFNNVKYKLRFLKSILEDIDSKNIKVSQIFFNKGENPIIVRND